MLYSSSFKTEDIFICHNYYLLIYPDLCTIKIAESKSSAKLISPLQSDAVAKAIYWTTVLGSKINFIKPGTFCFVLDVHNNFLKILSFADVCGWVVVPKFCQCDKLIG